MLQPTRRPRRALSVAIAALALSAGAAVIGTSGTASAALEPLPSTYPGPVGGPGGSWRPVFADDFNGTALNTTKWQPNWLSANDTTITGPFNGLEQQCYNPSHVWTGGGTLHISATADWCKAANGKTYSYTSGLINSRKSFTFTHGYAEARVWVDGTSAVKNWPAFWMVGTGSWPSSGEIDIFEGLEGMSCWHTHYSTGAAGGCPLKGSAAVGWHTFAADWYQGGVDFYYDGRYVATQRTASDSPMFLVANLSLSTTISPPVIAPSSMQIDYIRVWQR